MCIGTFARRLVLARKGRLRFGDPVIVLETIGQKQRAARLLLGIFGERDRRRLVGDGVERPNQLVAGAVQRRRSGGRDLEAKFLRAGRRPHVLFRRCHAALAGNVETDLAGRAHDERRAGRNRHRLAGVAVRPRRFARMNAGKNDRRLAGISGRRDPGVDAEVCRQHHALPVERRGDAFPMLPTSGDKSLSLIHILMWYSENLWAIVCATE